MIPRLAIVPSVDSCHGETEETEGEMHRVVTLFVDISIFLGIFNRGIISKWLLRSAENILHRCTVHVYIVLGGSI